MHGQHLVHHARRHVNPGSTRSMLAGLLILRQSVPTVVGAVTGSCAPEPRTVLLTLQEAMSPPSNPCQQGSIPQLPAKDPHPPPATQAGRRLVRVCSCPAPTATLTAAVTRRGCSQVSNTLMRREARGAHTEAAVPPERLHEVGRRPLPRSTGPGLPHPGSGPNLTAVHGRGCSGVVGWAMGASRCAYLEHGVRPCCCSGLRAQGSATYLIRRSGQVRETGDARYTQSKAEPAYTDAARCALPLRPGYT